MKIVSVFLFRFTFFFVLAASAFANDRPVVIGSKKFTESYVLGEIAKRSLSDAGIPAEHRQGMGGTIILWEALRSGQIDLYPEYTGTITQEILKRTDQLTFEQIANELGKAGIGMSEPLGFNNTYALVMLRSRADKLGLRTITDLKNHSELKFGLTHEFLDRQDGWRPLTQLYQLNSQSVIGIDHALGYAALAKGSIDVKDAYSTDAKISENDLVVLGDDRQFFPQYKAVFLFRFALPEPAISALRKLEGTIDEARMTRRITRAQPACISPAIQHRQSGRAVNHFRTNSRAGRRAISSWPGSHSSFPCWLEFRLGFSRAAAAQLDTSFSVLPELSRRFRRSHCWRSLSRCRFLGSASALRSRRFFSMACSRLCETPPPVCRTFHARCANRRSHSD